jgi:uncharacterized protein (DUF2237 family)
VLTIYPTVLGEELTFHAKGEGFHKDGYCRSSSKDDNGPRGNFSVAATLTHSFLQCEYGDDPPCTLDRRVDSPRDAACLLDVVNDLDKGHRAGQKMCISAHDFRQAIREMGPDTGPKIDLKATHERALEVVSMGDLKKYADATAGSRTRGGSL